MKRVVKRMSIDDWGDKLIGFGCDGASTNMEVRRIKDRHVKAVDRQKLKGHAMCHVFITRHAHAV